MAGAMALNARTAAAAVRLDAGALRWTSGAYLALLGALMLVAPHQFDGPAFAGLRAQLPWWGVVYFLAGAALVGIGALGPDRRAAALGHAVAGAALLLLASGVAAVGAWLGATGYAALGLANAAAAARAALARPEPIGPAGDLAAATVGLGSVASGLIVFLLPAQLGGPVFDPVRGLLPLYAAGYLIAGAGVAWTHLRPGAPRPVIWAVHLLLAATLWAFVAPFVPLRVWTGVLYAGLFGALLVATPLRLPVRASPGPPSLRTRLAVALAAAAALPLVAAVALTADRQEMAARDGALVGERDLAAAVAVGVERFVAMHRAAVAALAAEADLLARPAAEQRQRLAAVARQYPDVYILGTFDAAGRGLARTDDLPPAPSSAFAERVTASGAILVERATSLTLGRLVLGVGAPVRDAGGRVAGVVAGGVDPPRLAMQLAHASQRPDAAVFLVDADGRALAHPDNRLVTAAADLSGRPPVAAARGGAPGALAYAAAEGERFAGYAPVGELGWTVVAERPAAAVLADARRGRDLAYGALLIVLAAAAAGGWLLAGGLAAPLGALAAATGRLGEGGADEPLPTLPTGGVREIEALAAAFGALRERLAARTAERDATEAALRGAAAERARLYAAEQQAREAAEAAVRTRSEFLSVAAHELRNPIAALRGYAQLAARQLAGEPDRARLAGALAELERQTTRLNDLVGRLLDVARIDSGKLTLEPRMTDLRVLVEDVVATVRTTSPDHPVVVRAPERVEAVVDPLRVEQVLANLLGNAVKFSPPGSPVEVELSAGGDGHVRLAVRDRGVGVPPERRDRLFEPFHQAHGEGYGGGMGLGLYVSRQVAELHGGAIGAEFPSDGGARFVLTLPAEASARPRPTSSDGATAL
jgi:signal transduction histidine kinase